MQIHIDVEQWPMAAGCIGLANLYSEQELPRSRTGIYLNESILETLSEKYIYGLIEQFSVADRDKRRLDWYIQQVERKPEKIKQYATDAKKIINDQFKKIEKYFSDTKECQILKHLLGQLKEIKQQEQLKDFGEIINKVGEILKIQFIDEKLTLNYAKAVVLNPFFGQTSILQPKFNSKTTEEHILQIEKDFVKPAKLELMFLAKCKSSNTSEEIIQFLEIHQDYKPFKDILKPLKKMKDKDEMYGYIKNEVLPCSFVDSLIATQSYEELTFSPLSFSKNKAVNFNWNFDKQLPVPISAVARLVMFLAPFGVAFYTRKMGNDDVNEMLRFAGLIITQKHFSEVIKENRIYRKLRREGSSFEEAIVGLFQESLDKAKKLQQSSYFFVEVYSDYQSKKTLLDYYHMPAYLVDYLARNGKRLKLIYHRDIKDSYFRTILKGIDPKEIIYEYLRLAIKEPFHATGAFYAIRERKRILEAKRGVGQMVNYDGQISYVYYRGVDLRKRIVGQRSGESDTYRASGRKKLEGIAYRLLNAAKAGNKNAFMDTVFRVYMAAGLEIPSIFVESFKEEGLDFETISSAFVAGVLGQESIKKGDEVNG